MLGTYTGTTMGTAGSRSDDLVNADLLHLTGTPLLSVTGFEVVYPGEYSIFTLTPTVSGVVFMPQDDFRLDVFHTACCLRRLRGVFLLALDLGASADLGIPADCVSFRVCDFVPLVLVRSRLCRLLCMTAP